MRIRHARNTPLPDIGDSSQVQPSDWNADHIMDFDVLSENVSFTVNPSGEASFTTLKGCFDYLNTCLFKPSIEVNITLSAGIHDVGNTIMDSCLHSNIQVSGSAPVNLTITDAAITPMSGYRLVDYTVSGTIPSTVKTGTILVFHNGGAAYSDVGHMGSHVITNVSGQVITVMNRNAGTVPSFSSQTITGVTVYTTVLRATFASTGTQSIISIAKSKGMESRPYMRGIAFNGNNDNASAAIEVAGGAIVYFGDGSLYNNGIVITSCASFGLYAHVRSYIEFKDNSLVVSDCDDGIMISNAACYCGNYAITTACVTGMNCMMGTLRAFNVISVDNDVNISLFVSSAALADWLSERHITSHSIVSSSSTLE